MKDIILFSISLLLGFFSIVFLIEKWYVISYNGNSEIVFIEFQGTENNDYLEIFQLPEMKGKYVYVTLNLRGDSDEYREDLLSMEALEKRYKDSGVVFLYTVGDIEKWKNNYDWKKVIRKYKLKGYHLNLPFEYEKNLWEDIIIDGVNRGFRAPKYMLISKHGEIIDKWAPSPSSGDKLIDVLDGLLLNPVSSNFSSEP
jgi:hypothetical protein